MIVGEKEKLEKQNSIYEKKNNAVFTIITAFEKNKSQKKAKVVKNKG